MSIELSCDIYFLFQDPGDVNLMCLKLENNIGPVENVNMWGGWPGEEEDQGDGGQDDSHQLPGLMGRPLLTRQQGLQDRKYHSTFFTNVSMCPRPHNVSRTWHHDTRKQGFCTLYEF